MDPQEGRDKMTAIDAFILGGLCFLIGAICGMVLTMLIVARGRNDYDDDDIM